MTKTYRVVCESFDVVNEASGVGDLANIGVTYYNELTIIDSIMKKYPSSDALKEKLLSINSGKARKIASRIPDGLVGSQYRKYIAKYFAGRTIFRWLASLLLGELSLVYQGVKAFRNADRTADDHIIRKV